MSGREKTKDAQRFPLAWQGADGRAACCGNFGRGFLASSHAGTRLPIAAFSARTQGAPPLSAPGCPGRRSLFPQHILSSQSSHDPTKKPRDTRPAVRLRCHFLYRHYPYQVRRVEAGRFLSALRLPCGFRPHSTSLPGRCQEGSGPIFVKKAAKRVALWCPEE